MEYYVYQLRMDGSKDPFYIGKGKAKRPNHHFQPSSLKRNSYKNGIIKKCQKENIKIFKEIIFSALTDRQALIWEIKTIAFWGRLDIGTGCLANHTDGGEGGSGSVKSSDFKRMMSKIHTGRVFSEETKEKMRVSMNNRHKNGQLNTPEMIAKANLGRKGVKKPEGFSDIARKNAIGNKNNRGKVWITNGIDQKIIRLDDEIPIGWFRGQKESERSRKFGNKANTGKIWITDGMNNKMWPSEKIIPEGFIKGRIKL